VTGSLLANAVEARFSFPGMPRGRLHLVACWLAAVTVLVNSVAASAGLVRCKGPEGAVTLETGCNHDHCEAEGLQTRLASHAHDCGSECDCIDCECVDESAAVELVTRGSRTIDLVDIPTPTLYVVAWVTLPVAVPAVLCGTDPHSEPSPDVVLRDLRTIRLLI